MKRSAFTLIELLIVVAIIGILAAIAVPNFLNAQTRAKVARVHADLRSLSMAIEQFAMDNNDKYPYTNTVHNDNRYPLNVLTTPMAYMTALPEMDPFIPSDDAEKKSGIRDYWWNPYWLVSFPETTLYGASRPEVSAYAVGPLRYIVASVGPDMEFNGTPFSGFTTQNLYWVPYTPTNGLRSIGDLYRYGPGGTTSDAVADKRR